MELLNSLSRQEVVVKDEPSCRRELQHAGENCPDGRKEHRGAYYYFGGNMEWVGFGIDLATPGDVVVVYDGRSGSTRNPQLDGAKVR